MDIICINGSFDNDTLAIYKKYGVTTPEQEKLYNIRGVYRHTTGKVGILLEEIMNPTVPFQHPVLGKKWMEPTWNIERFRHLDSTPILDEELTIFERDPQRISCINYDLVNDLTDESDEP